MVFNSIPALILIDIQQGFDDVEYWGGKRNNPDAEIKAGELLTFWRNKNWPVFHVRHRSIHPQSPLYNNKPGFAFHQAVTPGKGEKEYIKNVNSAFIGTTLEEDLRKQGRDTVVIAGMTTNHCISTSVRMAGNLGFKTYLVADATATFNLKGADGKEYDAELLHQTELASLREEFCEVVRTDQLISSSVLD